MGMSEIQLSMWAEFRQFLRDRFTRPSRPRHSLAWRRSWTLLVVGVTGFFAVFSLTTYLAMAVSGWYAFLYVVVIAYGIIGGMFQHWYDTTHDVSR